MNKKSILKLRKSFNGTARNLTQTIADRLNNKGVATSRGKQFSYAGVLAVISGTYENRDVENEINLIIQEQKLNATI